METEIWKDIPGYEGRYRICNIGNKIESHWGNRWKLINVFINGRYMRVSLSIKGLQKPFSLHRLKAITFIPNPENKPQVNHIDGNKLNNDVSNLEWCTGGENVRHAHRIGLHYNNTFIKNHPMKGRLGKYHHHAKIISQYNSHGEFIRNWDSMASIYRELGISTGAICNVCKGRKKTTHGFIFRYHNYS